mgnify:FL=1
MVLGFLIFLFIRDPFNSFMRKILFENSNEEIHDKIINYINLSRKIFTLLYSTIIASILTKLNYVYVMTFLLVLSISFIIIIYKIFKLTKEENKNV